ncbi:hypothetical protein [Actinacidiphila sp. bgisy144]|uniref:hypothetical protein n=1 Tax=Actinacidiphila sp. bgisy144 TaxID=3413791 RepID=UPI003EB7DA02
MSVQRHARPAVKVGTHIRLRSVQRQAAALSGQNIHLIGPDGGGQVVPAGHLFTDPGFTTIGADTPQAAPQRGLLETAPTAAREKAPAWQQHVREVECGLPSGPDSHTTKTEQPLPAHTTTAPLPTTTHPHTTQTPPPTPPPRPDPGPCRPS